MGLIAYIFALIAFIPAEAVLDENDGFQVGGTIWNGNAVLGGTVQADWAVSPIDSISRLAFSARVRITGGGSDLTGLITQRGEQFGIDNLSGQLGGDTLEALFPRLPVRCSFEGSLRIERLRLGGQGQTAEGQMLTGPVSCTAKQLAGVPVNFPSLAGRIAPNANESTGSIATTGAQAVSLVEVRLSPKGALSIWPTQMAITRAPFLAGLRYDTVVD